jgi:patatin-related protein
MEHAAFCRLAHVATEAGRAESDFRDDNLPALMWAARASSSYAGAFPPFQHDELRRVLRDRRRVWPGEQRFLEHSIRARDGSPGVRHFDPLTRHFVDGGIVNNKPFGAALEALNHRPADRQVERCLVYVEPDPNLQDAVDPKRGFGYLATIRAALSSIPRNQPILDDLNAVVAQDARVQINRRIIDANRRQIDAQVAELRGVHGWRTLSLDRVTHLRTSMAGRAEQSMGLAYQAYLQRRLWRVVGALVRGWSDLAGATEDPSLIHAMEHAIVSGWGGVGEADGSSTTPEALNGVAGGQHQRQQSFLERFDVAFRIRRLQFLIRRINRYESERGLDERSRGALDALKQTTYGFMERCYRLRRSEQVDHELIDRLVSAAGRLPLPAAEALALLDTLAGSLDLVALDREIDQAFLAHHDAIDSDSVCDALTNDYLGFPVYDVLLLTPGSLEGAPDPLTPVRVERISPADARSLSDAFTGLRCRDFMGFLGFFNRDYREHDYLWGRLNGAERVIDLLVSVAGEGVLDPVALKREVFRVIVERERRRLGRLGPELDRIAAALG